MSKKDGDDRPIEPAAPLLTEEEELVWKNRIRGHQPPKEEPKPPKKKDE